LLQFFSPASTWEESPTEGWVVLFVLQLRSDMAKEHELDLMAEAIRGEFGDRVRIERKLPTADSGVLFITPLVQGAKPVIVELEAGTYTILVGGIHTFDGYDDPKQNGYLWALEFVRSFARFGLFEERRSVLGVPVYTAAVEGRPGLPELNASKAFGKLSRKRFSHPW
jgi:hypothetical protein